MALPEAELQFIIHDHGIDGYVQVRDANDFVTLAAIIIRDIEGIDWGRILFCSLNLATEKINVVGQQYDMYTMYGTKEEMMDIAEILVEHHGFHHHPV